MRFQHPSYYGRVNRTASAEDERPATPEPPAVDPPPARYARRACCCPAPPSVIAVTPAADERQAAVELLLCGHHYRQSRRALAAIGATLTDLNGHSLRSQTWPESDCPNTSGACSS
jgi:hypothetical protein